VNNVQFACLVVGGMFVAWLLFAAWVLKWIDKGKREQ